MPAKHKQMAAQVNLLRYQKASHSSGKTTSPTAQPGQGRSAYRSNTIPALRAPANTSKGWRQTECSRITSSDRDRIP